MYFSACIFLVSTGLCFTVGKRCSSHHRVPLIHLKLTGIVTIATGVDNPKNDGFGKFFAMACKDNSQVDGEGWCLFQCMQKPVLFRFVFCSFSDDVLNTHLGLSIAQLCVCFTEASAPCAGGSSK